MSHSKDVVISQLSAELAHCKAHIAYLEKCSYGPTASIDKQMATLPERITVALLPGARASVFNEFDRGISQVITCENATNDGNSKTWAVFHSHFTELKPIERLFHLLELNDRLVEQVTKDFSK